MTAAAYAPIPAVAEVTDAPVSNANIAELEMSRVLFFAHDTITDREKRELSFKAFGGIFLPHIKTLRDTKGMLYRCQLTRLPKFKMVPDWKAMLGPVAIRDFEAGFVQTVIENGQAKQRTVQGFMGSDAQAVAEGEFKQKRSDHVVYKKRYPGHDVRRAIERAAPNGPGGVVEITALKGASNEEVEEAQLYFFPNWTEIRAGVEELPHTIKAMENHLKARIEQVKSQPWDDAKKSKYFSIGNDMLRSCSEFQRHALATVKSDEIIVKDAAQKGAAGVIGHSDITDKYLEQTETRRKEDLITGEHSATKDLVEEMRAERAEKAEVARTRLLLEERKQYLAEVTAGIRERDADEETRLGIRKTNEPKIETPLAAEPIQPIREQTFKGLATEEGVTVVGDTPIRLDDYATGDNTFAIPIPQVSKQEDGEIIVAPITERLCGRPTAQGQCARALKGEETACWQHKS